MEAWSTIAEFPDYDVSDAGRIRNNTTDRILRTSNNQRGYSMVGLRKGGLQFMRSLTVLVAEAFLHPPHDPELFNSLIHRDGNKDNSRALNLMWRPRGYAIKYHQQFEYFRFNRKLSPVGLDTPVQEIHTGNVYDDTTHCAISEGLLETQLVVAISNDRPIGLTGQHFRRV